MLAYREVHLISRQGAQNKSAETFDKRSRLSGPNDFKRVFDKGQLKVSDKHTLILGYTSNAIQPKRARLGIVVAKKNVARACERNRLKRLIREQFRKAFKDNVLEIDLVVLVRRSSIQLDNRRYAQSLIALFDKVKKQSNKLATYE